MTKSLFFKIFLIIFFSSKLLFSITADVEDISNRKYFPSVLEAIQNAETSIKASLYYISYFPTSKGHVRELLDSLFEASKRGVNIVIILDRGYVSHGSNDTSKKNAKAFSLLKQNGIKVFYDDIKTLSHSKYLIIDDKIVIVGSTNWSEKALTHNREAAVLIKSPNIAKEYLQIFDKIPKFSPEPVKNAIPIPMEFLNNQKLAAETIRRHNPRAFDLYLWLQKRSFETQSSIITMTKEDILKVIYKGEQILKKEGFFENVMKSCFRRYKKKYDFMKSCKKKKFKDFIIIELFKTNEAKFNSLYLSDFFWKDGWNDRLTHKAQFCLLYVLEKTESGRMGRYFSQKQWDAKREFGPNHVIFSYGLTELQRYNIIEKNIYAGANSTTPNDITLNGLYIYTDFQKKLNELETKTDKELFQTVSKIADLVNEPCDLEVYENLIALGNEYGLKILKDTLTVVKKHQVSASPYKRYDYVVGMIKAAGQGKWEMSLLEFEEFKEKEKLKNAKKEKE